MNRYIVTVSPKYPAWNERPYTVDVYARTASKAIKITRREVNDGMLFDSGATYRARLLLENPRTPSLTGAGRALAARGRRPLRVDLLARAVLDEGIDFPTALAATKGRGRVHRVYPHTFSRHPDEDDATFREAARGYAAQLRGSDGRPAVGTRADAAHIMSRVAPLRRKRNAGEAKIDKTKLGTGRTFTRHISTARNTVAYSIRFPIQWSHGRYPETFRIAPDEHRSGWRIDYAGMMGSTWEAVNATVYSTQNEAAGALVKMYESGDLQRRLTRH